ncbi:MAG: VanW family protein [Clostridia bacterium]|nr:VanW family protein [Clostridia bacterium]
MKSKIFYIAILTVFLVSTVCFLPKNASANQKGVHITFVCNDKTFVYDQSKVVYDKRDHDTLSALERRGFWLDGKQKAELAKMVQAHGFGADVAVKYLLVGIDKVFDDICSFANVAKIDSNIVFDTSWQNPFDYTPGRDGVRVDMAKLCSDIVKKLATQNKFVLQVPTAVERATSVADNKNKTALRSFFETNCANSTQNRKDNIALALSKFDGMVVGVGESVSFNKVVGKRTMQNGYKQAKVILNGKYVDGVGGGVCQASTTLYNALLLAGLDVTEWHRHTLKSNYIKPSFDAMVNDNGADLVFANNTDEKIYIKAKCDGQSAKVWVYGVQSEVEYKTLSVVEKKTKAQEVVFVDRNGDYADKVTFEEDSFCLQNPVDGVESKGYLVATKHGRTLHTKLLRTDNYAKVDKIVVKGAKKREQKPDGFLPQAQTYTICQA